LLQDPYGITFWPEFKGRDGCRTPIAWEAATHGGFTEGKPWLPVDEKHIARAASVQERDPQSPLAFARRFIAWRRTMPQLTRGDITFFDAPEPVLALRRDVAGERSVLAVFNLGRDAVTLPLPQAAGAQTISEPGLPGSVAADGTVTLPACGAWFGYAQ
jgi:alpha-glucosidase